MHIGPQLPQAPSSGAGQQSSPAKNGIDTNALASIAKHSSNLLPVARSHMQKTLQQLEGMVRNSHSTTAISPTYKNHVQNMLVHAYPPKEGSRTSAPSYTAMQKGEQKIYANNLTYTPKNTPPSSSPPLHPLLVRTLENRQHIRASYAMLMIPPAQKPPLLTSSLSLQKILPNALGNDKSALIHTKYMQALERNGWGKNYERALANMLLQGLRDGTIPSPMRAYIMMLLKRWFEEDKDMEQDATFQEHIGKVEALASLQKPLEALHAHATESMQQPHTQTVLDFFNALPTPQAHILFTKEVRSALPYEEADTASNEEAQNRIMQDVATINMHNENTLLLAMTLFMELARITQLRLEALGERFGANIAKMKDLNAIYSTMLGMTIIPATSTVPEHYDYVTPTVVLNVDIPASSTTTGDGYAAGEPVPLYLAMNHYSLGLGGKGLVDSPSATFIYIWANRITPEQHKAMLAYTANLISVIENINQQEMITIQSTVSMINSSFDAASKVANKFGDLLATLTRNL